MKKFVENLAALIKVKTIVTFVVIVVYAVLALRGNITPENVQNLTMVVVAFYFGTQLKESGTAAEQIEANHVSSCPFMLGEIVETEHTETEPETDTNERAE